MRQVRLFILCVMALLAVVACKRMPLYDLEKAVRLVLDLDLRVKLDIKVDVKVDVEVDTVIHLPEHMKACFYAPDTDNLKYTEYVGPTGGSISTPAGTYNMVVYTFGTEYVQIRGENNINTLEAFTSDITATKGAVLRGFTRADGEEPPGPVVFTPDHLLVARQTVVIPEFGSESQTITIETEATTIVETYGLLAKKVEGAEYIGSCEAFITNQARSNFFGRGEVNREPATIWFPVGLDRQKGMLFTVFNTFGKLPGESRCYLHLLIRDTDGLEYHYTEDITDDFEHPNHVIEIGEEIIILEPKSHGGGIDPTVDPWDEEDIDVPIG